MKVSSYMPHVSVDLQSIPADTFACPFEQRSLNVDVERISAPQLETSWTEHMMIKPIKPNIFPHSAMPNTRPRGKQPRNMHLRRSHAGQWMIYGFLSFPPSFQL